MAKKFIETGTTTVISFKDIHTNPSVETEKKQAKYRGDCFNQVLEMFYILKPSQLNFPVGTIFQRSSVQLNLSWVIFRFTWCLFVDPTAFC
jgi:hypothetical protein